MAEFPYTQTVKSIRILFDQIQAVGKPTKVNQKWIESIGLKTKSDKNLPGVLKFLGFVDGAGVPTQIWMDYRDKTKSAIVLAQSMRASYSTLFAMYPEAHKKDDEALNNFFTSNTTVAAVMVTSILNTFKALRDLADFEADVPESIEDDVADAVVKKEERKKPSIGAAGGPLAITVNIQLQVPATEDASVYDKFFESLYKHVLSKDKS